MACGAGSRSPDAGGDAGARDSGPGVDGAVPRDAGPETDATCEEEQQNAEEPAPCYLGEPGEDLPGAWEVEPGSQAEIFHVEAEAAGSPFSIDRAGDGYGLLWSDSGELGHVWLSRLDADGQMVGEPLTLSRPAPEQPHPLVWTGTEHVLLWGDERNGEREIYLQPFSADLAAGAERRLTRGDTPQDRPGAVWDVHSVAVAWSDGNLLFQRADPTTGTIAGTERALTSFGTVSSSRPDLAVADGRIAVAFVDSREGQDDAYLAIVDEAGEPTSSDGLKVEATEWLATDPQVVWTGEEFFLAWNEEWNVLLARADADGAPIEGSARIVAPFAGEPSTPAHAPHKMYDLLWTGTELLVVGVRAASGGMTESIALRLDREGAPDPDGLTVISSLVSDGGWTSESTLGVVLGPTEVAVVWGEIQHFGGGESRISFARLVLTGD